MEIGTEVRRSASGETGVVVRVSGDLCEVVFPSGRFTVHRDDLEPLPSDPASTLAMGQVGRGLPYALRLQALYLQHAYRFDPLSGLSNARIKPALHQVYIAHLVTQKLQPRMILADEVGLGKTIEAGLIIKELRARGLVERVLIVVPASLQLQWQHELRSKFNEEFEIIDGAALKFLGRDGSNPWTKRQNVITSLQFARNQKRSEKLIEADWDLVVFDEAHYLRYRYEGKNKSTATHAYRLADKLKELVNGLLLLTATPMQLHPLELYSLIELVEPGLYPSFEAYDERRRELPWLNDLMRALKRWSALSEDERAEVIEEYGSLLGELASPGTSIGALLDDAEAREVLMDRLVERHPLAGVLVRNRKAEIGGFTSRSPSRILVELSEEERELYSDLAAYIQQVYNRAVEKKNHAVGFVMVTYQKMLTSSSHAIRKSLKRRVDKLRTQLAEAQTKRRARFSDEVLDELREAGEASAVLDEIDTVAVEELLEWEIQRIDALVERLGRIRDSKAAELLKLLRTIFSERPDEKLIVFTQFIETQEFLRGVLENAGYRVAVFNGQLTLEEKEAAVSHFRRDAQVMISTEAGGEGRNFQFCHLMVNYDLPWNPMRVEQRIGRLDRIGQARPVFIYNLACAGTVEERVLDVLEHRIGLFEESVGSLDPILGEVEKDIERLVMEHLERFDEEFDQYVEDLERRVLEAKEKERTLADFVLDRASFRRDRANELLGQTPLARDTDLREFVAAALEYHGGHLSQDAQGADVISLSPQLLTRLRARRSVIRGAFDWRTALDREELEFFAFGHELIDRIVDLPVSVDPHVTGARRVPGVPAGTWVEIFYEFRSQGVRASGEVRRHLVGADLEVRSEQVRSMPPLGEPLDGFEPPAWIADAVRASREVHEREYEERRERARAEDEQVKSEELRRAERIFGYRKVRLEKLIAEQEAWIKEAEEHGSERQRRILPARRGRLEKDRQRLQTLALEHQQQIEGIRQRQVGVDARILAAGIVVGA
jgi:SNF2 family DNA or RNA helicase